jgi:hypothetical protein
VSVNWRNIATSLIDWIPNESAVLEVCQIQGAISELRTECITDGRSVGWQRKPAETLIIISELCASCVPDLATGQGARTAGGCFELFLSVLRGLRNPLANTACSTVAANLAMPHRSRLEGDARDDLAVLAAPGLRS